MDLIERQAAIDALGERPLAWEQGEYEDGLIAQWESDVEAIKDLPPAQFGTNLAEVGTDCISRQAALDIFDDYNVAVENGQIEAYSRDRKRLCDLPPAQPEIIHCKDCVKHNKGVGDLEVLPDGKRSWIWKDQACPLVSWRGKAQGHEFDYQYCVYAERRTDG